MRGPSKKIILTAMACVVVVGGIYLSTKVKSEKVFMPTETEKLLPDIVVNESVKNTSTIDTDGDGLKDWEEVLWKTDPLKSDTDGNGISDAKEIETRQLQQSSQQMVATVGGKEIAKVTIPENLTLTDRIAMETFAQYINYKQTGVPITEEYTQKLLDEAFGNATTKQELAKFTSKNLSNIIESENDEIIHDYGNSFWSIVLKNTPKTEIENEYITFLLAIQTENEKELDKLAPLADGYANTIREALAMPVPRSAVERHLDIINSMNSILAHIEDMRVYFKDPARGFKALIFYKDSVPELQESLENLIKYFEEKNIKYGEEESGYSLMHSI